MKKIIYNFFFLVSVSILISSCSSSNSGFHKQKYTGFKQGNGAEAVKTGSKKQKSLQPVFIKEETVSEASNPVQHNNEFNKQETKTVLNKPGQTTESCSSPDENAIHKHRFSSIKSKIRKLIFPSKAESGGESDANTILMILLCIFLPPVAILLHEGVGTPFWLDLIIWLIGIGAVGGFYYLGVLVLIAIIYAIIICF